MGCGRLTADDWSSYSRSTSVDTKSVHEIYTASKINKDFDPKNIKMRESCDSVDNPNSTAMIVAADVTGSMGRVLDSLIKNALPTLVTEMFSRKPITDPHMMFMGVGDVEAHDEAPLQVTQFEADIRIAEQLTSIWLEQGGGGNGWESYLLPLYFAANHTKIDCMEKRNKKGYLFTIGDEPPQPKLYADDINTVFGYKPQTDYSADDLLTMAGRSYNIFHILVTQGNGYSPSCERKWRELYGQKLLVVDDINKIAEVIISAIQVVEGANKEDVVGSWDGSTSLTVQRALGELSSVSAGTDLVTF